MEKQHTTTEDMLDVLADYIKKLIEDAKTPTNITGITMLLEIYFKYSTDTIPPAQRKKK